MSLHINRFVDNIKAHESRNARDFTMLLTLQGMRDMQTAGPEVIQVELTGGGFKST